MKFDVAVVVRRGVQASVRTYATLLAVLILQNVTAARQERNLGVTPMPPKPGLRLSEGIAGLQARACQLTGPKHDFDILLMGPGDWRVRERVMVNQLRTVHRGKNSDIIRIQRASLSANIILGNVDAKSSGSIEEKMDVDGERAATGVFIGTHSADVSIDFEPVVRLDSLVKSWSAQRCSVSPDGILTLDFASSDSVAELRRRALACLPGATISVDPSKTLVTKTFDNASIALSLQSHASSGSAQTTAAQINVSKSEVILTYHYTK